MLVYQKVFLMNIEYYCILKRSEKHCTSRLRSSHLRVAMTMELLPLENLMEIGISRPSWDQDTQVRLESVKQ